MSEELEKLLKVAAGVQLSPDDKEQQRRSFAYGNAHIENSLVTRETVDAQAEQMTLADQQ